MTILDRLRAFRRTRQVNDRITIAIYEAIVAAARQPGFYAECGVPDTPLGRFEMIGLHMAALINAGRGGPPAQTQLLQSVTEEFFQDVDHALRELGIGDTGVPKRMKKLASMFYGRADALRAGLDGNDIGMIADAVARNIWPEEPDAHREGAARIATYLAETDVALKRQLPEPVTSGQIVFPEFRP